MSESAAGEESVRAFRVTGRVQGVGFRWWTRRTAEELQVAGSVRNCRDGSVEVKASGAPDAVEQLREALAEGPASARVEGVAEMEADPKTHRNAFHIHP